jgi:hypothetical protein
MQNEHNRKATKNVMRVKPGGPRNAHIEALSLIYQGHRQLGELERSRYDVARKHIPVGLTSATQAMLLGDRLAG